MTEFFNLGKNFSLKLYYIKGLLKICYLEPYNYLVDTIRNFLPTKELLEKMRRIGFQQVEEEVIIKDLVNLYSCKK